MMTPSLWLISLAQDENVVRSAMNIDMYDFRMTLACVLMVFSIVTMIYLSSNLKPNH
jgi:hypothetical protein